MPPGQCRRRFGVARDPRPAGTVLFTSRAPIGYVAIAASPVSTNQGFKSGVLFLPDWSRYIALAMLAFLPEFEASAPGTTFKDGSGKIVAGIPFQLPPLAEQHRIVAKVDEVMALCDWPEAGLATADGTRYGLLESPLRYELTRWHSPQTKPRPPGGHEVLDPRAHGGGTPTRSLTTALRPTSGPAGMMSLG